MATQQNVRPSLRRETQLRGLLMFTFSMLAATWASAAIIDFETTPAGLSPSDDLVLPVASTYNFPGLQISFGIDSDSNGTVETDAVFENAGPNPGEPPNGGFSGSSGTDTADPGFTAQLGQWFLRSPVGGSDFGKFVILYSGTTTVTAASGEIWDIDGTAQPGGGGGQTEEYTVRAYDAASTLLATQVSPLGTLTTPFAPLDGRPWVFSFSGLTAGIARIEVDFTGTKTAGIGLAFNNFNPTLAAVPEPASWLLVAAGIGMMAWRRPVLRHCRHRGDDAMGCFHCYRMKRLNKM